MELVYLWVEEYKNIKNQGFNFSPRFEFHYDKDSKKLTKVRDESTTYKSIFPDNINITAIVGENGSGKSSLLKLIHKNLLIWKGSGFAIFKDENNQTLYSGEIENYPFLKDYGKLYSDNRKIDFPFFEYSYTYDRDIDYNNEFIYPKKQINMIKGVIHLIDELFRNQKNILLNYFDLKTTKQLNKFESFFIPKTINIFFDLATIKPNERFPKLEKNSEINLEKLKNSIYNNMTTDYFIRTIKDISNLLTDKNSYTKLLNKFNYFNPQWEFKLGKSDTQKEEFYNLWNNSYNSSIDLNSFSEIKNIQSITSNEEWLKQSDFLIYSFDIEKLNAETIEIIMTSFSSYQFTIQLCDIDNKALNDLSFGEQQLLFILNQLYSLKDTERLVPSEINYENKVHEIESLENIENYIVLLDEIDIGWHPMWQKKSINYICEFLKLLPNINFHLIFATHSPFILSDIPKENVIFLDKYKENEDKNQKIGNCKNATKNIDIKTFGANIHTLFSDGFFMSDGLMGEFAKNKIRTIQIAYKYVSHRNKQKSLYKKEHKKSRRFIRTQLKKLWYIQSIIGEKFLQTIMKNYLQEIEEILFGNEKAIDNEIERLQNLRKSIKNAKA